MGLDWDKALPALEVIKEYYRVLKASAFRFIMCALGLMYFGEWESN